jgi:hypothetical protein
MAQGIQEPGHVWLVMMKATLYTVQFGELFGQIEVLAQVRPLCVRVCVPTQCNSAVVPTGGLSVID